MTGSKRTTFRVAMLLKTQFACHRFRGKLTTKEERIHSFYMSKTSKYGNDSHKNSSLCRRIYFILQRKGNKKSPFGEAFYYFFYKNIYFPMNKIVSMYMRRLTFLVCPVSALINV